MDKRTVLMELGLKRQRTKWPGYAGIGDYHSGVYECEHVSPYTKSAGNVDSFIMVILQDWSSDKFLRGPVDDGARDLGRTPRLPTNRNLERLIRNHFGLELRQIYATNLFPFIKMGDMTNTIPNRDLV